MGRITNRFAKGCRCDGQYAHGLDAHVLLHHGYDPLGLLPDHRVLLLLRHRPSVPLDLDVLVLRRTTTGLLRREMKRHEAVLAKCRVLLAFRRGGDWYFDYPGLRSCRSQFSKSVNDAIDSMDGAYFLTYANQRWLAVRLDAVGTLLVFTVGILGRNVPRFSINP